MVFGELPGQFRSQNSTPQQRNKPPGTPLTSTTFPHNNIKLLLEDSGCSLLLRADRQVYHSKTASGTPNDWTSYHRFPENNSGAWVNHTRPQPTGAQFQSSEKHRTRHLATATRYPAYSIRPRARCKQPPTICWAIKARRWWLHRLWALRGSHHTYIASSLCTDRLESGYQCLCCCVPRDCDREAPILVRRQRYET
jgi:hypothetical protein